jgi:hypothetical protein
MACAKREVVSAFTVAFGGKADIPYFTAYVCLHSFVAGKG